MSLISSINGLSQALMGPAVQNDPANPANLPGGAQGLERINQTLSEIGIAPGEGAGRSVTGGRPPSFGDMLQDLVTQVDTKQKAGHAEAKKLMTGESDNLHQSMIAMQEAGVAFTMLVEVRNKLMESYQEILRMQV